MAVEKQNQAESSENRPASADRHTCSGACSSGTSAACPRQVGGQMAEYPGPQLRQALAVAGMSVGCILDGIVIAYSSPAIPSLLAKDSSIQIDHHHASWIGSIHTLGAVLGCIISIPAMERLGRRGAALYIMSMAYLIGFLLIGAAFNVEMIITGRFCGGVGLGLTLSITPVYLVEVSSLSIRGMLGVVPPLFTQIGLLATYLSGCWMDWRTLALSGVAIVILFVIFVWIIPESPVYLASKGRFEEAEGTLAQLGRKDDLLRFFKEIQTDLNVFDMTLADSWRQYFDPRVVRPFLSCLALMFFFQATGYNTIIAYSLILFRESGQTIHEHLATGITGGVILLSALLAIGLAKVSNRKTLLVISALGTSSSLIILGVYYYLKQEGPLPKWTFVPLLSMLMMITFFMIGFGAVSWTVMAEILPAKVRGHLYPFTVAFTWVCNFGFAKSFVYIQRSIGSYGAFWTYALLTLSGTLFIIKGLPETRNKSSEEIEIFFNRLSRKSWSTENVIQRSDIV